jgi:hypothetical protein
MIHFDKYLVIRIFPYDGVEVWSVDNFPRSRFPTGLASYPEYLSLFITRGLRRRHPFL